MKIQRTRRREVIGEPQEIKAGQEWFDNKSKRVATVMEVDSFKIDIRYNPHCLLSKRVFMPTIFLNGFTKQ